MRKHRPKNSGNSLNVSRRAFLKTMGVGAAATGLSVPAPRPAEAAILGPDAILCSPEMCQPGRACFEAR